ncbi:DUF1349 domain-containing protein [Microtetraspora malaysiensis]|uniref:DUF1349 domain-containing protein n=1 Tax=Microtetraspora malaysiensis TaxID=161358 RepID=A0ABW6T604_9ACTN
MPYTGWEWINEPRDWAAGEVLRVVADPGTDFWQKTHYGFTHDNGHIFGRVMNGDLRITATFELDWSEQYDQAGVALRIDEENWIKTGVELVDGAPLVSAVVTRGWSDWSVVAAPDGFRSVTVDLERTGDTVTVRYGLDGAAPERMLRLAYFPPDVPAFAGVMCAAPTGKGFETRFGPVSLT